MRLSLKRFAVASAVLVLVSVLIPDGLLDVVRRATAGSAWWVTTLLGEKTTLIGAEIVTRTRVLDVAVTCLPLGVLAVYCALVIAENASWPRRLWGAAFGILALWLANVARVVLGVWAAQRSAALFDALHQGVIQVIPVAFALATWMLWAQRDAKSRVRVMRWLGVVALWLALLAAVYLPASAGYVAALKAVVTSAAGAFGLTIESGPQGLSAWLLPALAVMLAARLPWQRRLAGAAALLGGAFAVDAGIVVAVAALGVRPEAAQPVYAGVQAVLPFLGVVAISRGDLRRLWSDRVQ